MRGGREAQGGEKKKRGQKKVDLPVAQLVAAHSRYYLLRLESPVSRGRTAEEAKYVTGDRQVSERARSGGLRASEGQFDFSSVLSAPPPSPHTHWDFSPNRWNWVRFPERTARDCVTFCAGVTEINFFFFFLNGGAEKPNSPFLTDGNVRSLQGCRVPGSGGPSSGFGSDVCGAERSASSGWRLGPKASFP